MAYKRSSISHESGPSKRQNTDFRSGSQSGSGEAGPSKSSVKFINFTKSGGKESYTKSKSRLEIIRLSNQDLK